MAWKVAENLQQHDRAEKTGIHHQVPLVPLAQCPRIVREHGRTDRNDQTVHDDLERLASAGVTQLLHEDHF